MYSESYHSDKEEARHDPDSECAPLIDPWYDVYPSFPKIPSDYMPLLPSRVWAPVSSSIYDLVIC